MSDARYAPQGGNLDIRPPTGAALGSDDLRRWIAAERMAETWLPSYFHSRYDRIDSSVNDPSLRLVRLGDVVEQYAQSPVPGGGAAARWRVETTATSLTVIERQQGQDFPADLLLLPAQAVLLQLTSSNSVNVEYWDDSLFPGGGAANRDVLILTRELFEHRSVLRSASYCLGGADYSAWLKDAVSTQLLIYQLDSCYEQSVEIDPAREQPLWRLLTERLRQAPCSSRDLLWANLRDLKAYALAEARIHSFDIIDPREFESIVRLKCADVRIARSSAWLYAGFDLDASSLRYWEMYDEAWELIEDLVDIGEDGRDWNFNFWLYTFMAGESGSGGVLGAANVLVRRLRALECAYADLSGPLTTSFGTSFRRTLSAGEWAIRNQWRPLVMMAGRNMTTYRRLLLEPIEESLPDLRLSNEESYVDAGAPFLISR